MKLQIGQTAKTVADLVSKAVPSLQHAVMLSPNPETAKGISASGLALVKAAQSVVTCAKVSQNTIMFMTPLGYSARSKEQKIGKLTYGSFTGLY